VSGGRGELVISNMVPPPPGRIYELWREHAGGPPEPTNALFDVTRQGSADVTVPGPLTRIARVLVTAEPQGGSQAPTRAPVIVAPTA
jgi:anti-sigma-K factor RskA